MLTKPDIQQAVPEALEGLYHIHAGGAKTTARADLSINACMVISVFLQWLVRHLAKRLIQLMTMEAVTSHYRTLPLAYTETYLQHQSHFHLKTLIEKQIQVLELDDQIDRSVWLADWPQCCVREKELSRIFYRTEKEIVHESRVYLSLLSYCTGLPLVQPLIFFALPDHQLLFTSSQHATPVRELYSFLVTMTLSSNESSFLIHSKL